MKSDGNKWQKNAEHKEGKHFKKSGKGNQTFNKSSFIPAFHKPEK